MSKQVGKRKFPSVCKNASSEMLRRGCEVNDALHRLPTGDTTFFKRGVYRYKNFEEANQHWQDCLVSGMASVAEKNK